MLANWTGPLGTGKTWDKGDFEGDGGVSDDDLSLLLANWTGPVGAIPEPATLGLLAFGVMVLLRDKHRR